MKPIGHKQTGIMTRAIAALLLAQSILMGIVHGAPAPGPERFAVGSGLEMVIFAGTEDIANPVSIDVDDRGRIWVLETINYRKKVRATGDRVLILEDTDGDGTADSQKLFYEGPDIDGAHGICVLDNRVIISASDRIVQLIDTTGDDRADTNTVLFKGKVLRGPHGQHDHALHAFQFGPDGRLYFNFGNYTSELLDAAGKPIVDIHGNVVANKKQPYMDGMALRCELDGSNVEVLGHNFRNNWELTVDSFGSMWQSDNDNGSNSCRINYVMEHGNYGYRDEITGLGYKSSRTNMSPDVTRSMWHQNDPGVVPNLLITGYGAPAGIQVYEGDLLPKSFQNQLLLAEPARNVLWSIPVERVGAGYTASTIDLLRTPESKSFRPCDVSVAPDGSLYVADWYDPIVCCHATEDDRGRIYRLAPPGHTNSIPVFDYATAEGAVAATRSPNLATRYKAWTALTGMGNATRGSVLQLAKDPNARIRARALWLLAASDGNPTDAAKLAMADADPDVRAMTLRIVRRHKADTTPYVQSLLNDNSAIVHRECAISLRHQAATSQKARQWAALAAMHDGKDRWYLEALGIGAHGHDEACFAAWLKSNRNMLNTAAGRDIVWRSRADAAVSQLIKLLRDRTVPDSEHLRLVRAFDFHNKTTTKPALLAFVRAGHAGTSARAYLEAVDRLDMTAVETIPNVKVAITNALKDCSDQALVVKLVARYGLQRQFIKGFIAIAIERPATDAGVASIKEALAFGGSKEILAAAAKPHTVSVLDALGYAGTAESIALLKKIAGTKDQAAQVRTRSLQGLAKSNAGFQVLLGFLKSKNRSKVLRDESARLLLMSSGAKARTAALKHLGIGKSGMADPLTRLPALLKTRGKPAPGGQAAFAKAGCFACHKVGNQGLAYGPDLSAIGSLMGKPELFSAILAPSLSIKFGFEGEVITLKDGSTLTGCMSGENETTVSLRLPGGITRDVPKRTIKHRKKMTTSLMPPGLDALLTNDELADMVAWLMTQRAE